MKSSLKTFAFLAILAGFVTSAQADSLTLTTGSYSNLSYGGGAFLAKPTSGPINNASYSSLARAGSSTGFLTFCLEYNEHFSPGESYNYVVSNNAVNSNTKGQPKSDGLSNATAWLYSQFAKGTLGSVVSTFSYTQAGFSNMQRAVWLLEDEKYNWTGASVGVDNDLAQAAKAQFGQLWSADNNGALGVKALNLTNGSGTAQDQLYYHVPDQGLTVALLGLALVGVAGFRRKFSITK